MRVLQGDQSAAERQGWEGDFAPGIFVRLLNLASAKLPVIFFFNEGWDVATLLFH